MILSFRTLLVSTIVVVTFACSTGPKAPHEEIPVVGEERDGIETVVIMGFNDIHGALAPERQESKESDGKPGVSYFQGGAATLAGHVQILRSEMGPRLLIMDTGDHFQGAIESNLFKGKPMVSFFNQIGVTATTLGNHEFDFGPENNPKDVLGALKARASEAKYPYVISNISLKGTQALPPIPGAVRHAIVTAGKLKIGLIGLTTPETPVITRPDFVTSLAFNDVVEATRREAASLRNEGANIIVVLGHIGISCQRGKTQPGSTIRKPSDPQGKCDDREEVPQLLKALPPGTVDAVIAGHSHQVVHHWVDGVPVIQAGSRLQYYNLIYFTYDWKAKKLLTDRTRIEGPVPVCPAIFENQKDCNGSRPAPAEGRGRLVLATLHGHTVTPDQSVDTLLHPVFAAAEAENHRIVGQVAQPIEHTRTGESALGYLVADAVRESVTADVAFVNPGGLRAPFEAGPLTYEKLFRALPFDNTVSLLNVTGKELKLILRVAENGARGYFPISGVKIRMIDVHEDAPSTDLNGNGKIEPWEVNRIREIHMADGTPIRDNAMYRLATLDFLVHGGDDMGWVLSQVPRSRVTLTAGGVVREAVAAYLAKHSPVNTMQNPIITPDNPRIKAEKPAKGGKSGKKHRSKKRRQKRLVQ